MKNELNNEDEIEEIDGISIVQFYSDEINYHMEAIKDIEEQLKYFQSNDKATKAPVTFNYDTCGLNLVDDYEDDIIYIYEEEEEDVEEED